MKNNIVVPEYDFTKNNSCGRGFISDENIVKHIPQRIPDIGMIPEDFNDPEYSLEVVSRLTKMIRKIIIGMMDDQLVELTEKNMNAFIFLLSIIKDCNIRQFEMYNTASEKDQLSILREVKHNCLYIAYDTDVPTHEVIYRLVKIVNDSTGDIDGK